MRSKSFATWRAHASLQRSLILDEIGRLPLCQQASGGLTALFGNNDGAGSIAAVLGEHRQQSLKMIPTAPLTENKVFMRAKIVGRSGQNTRASPLGKRVFADKRVRNSAADRVAGARSVRPWTISNKSRISSANGLRGFADVSRGDVLRSVRTSRIAPRADATFAPAWRYRGHRGTRWRALQRRRTDRHFHR
jgi:hypothetical protein